jgi:hypothetical protein
MSRAEEAAAVPRLAELAALRRVLEETGWILALYPSINGIGPPALVREGSTAR